MAWNFSFLSIHWIVSVYVFSSVGPWYLPWVVFYVVVALLLLIQSAWWIWIWCIGVWCVRWFRRIADSMSFLWHYAESLIAHLSRHHPNWPQLHLGMCRTMAYSVIDRRNRQTSLISNFATTTGLAATTTTTETHLNRRNVFLDGHVVLLFSLLGLFLVYILHFLNELAGKCAHQFAAAGTHVLRQSPSTTKEFGLQAILNAQLQITYTIRLHIVFAVSVGVVAIVLVASVTKSRMHRAARLKGAMWSHRAVVVLQSETVGPHSVGLWFGPKRSVLSVGHGFCCLGDRGRGSWCI